MSKTSVAAITFVVGAVVTLAALAIIPGRQLVDLEIVLPGGVTTKLKTSEGKLDFFDLIGNLFSDPMKADATRGVLEGKGIYELSSANLGGAIERINEGDLLAESLRKMLRFGAGPFKHDQHSFRDIRDADVVDEFDQQAKDSYEVVVKKLREHCEYDEGFCQAKGIVGYVSFGMNVKQGEGAVCSSSRLVGRSVAVANKQSRRQVIVKIQKYFWPCVEVDLKNKDNFILLNDQDGKERLGTNAATEVVLHVAPLGFTADTLLPDEKIVGDPAREVVLNK